jgi:hypothetical protein
VGCTNNITTDVTILPWILNASPSAIVSGQPVTVDYGGALVFAEAFIDQSLAAVAGLGMIELVDAVATAVPRAGLTGPAVALSAAPVPLTCGSGANVGLPCITAADCPPGAPFVVCGQFIPIPIIDGAADACAACNAINATKAAQCAINGYCVAPGGLSIPLQSATETYTADASGQVLIGFDDLSTGATVAANGTYNLPAASFPAPATPNGARVIAEFLQIALQCTMAVDSGGPDGPVPPVPDQASPTPDSRLLQFPILIP